MPSIYFVAIAVMQPTATPTSSVAVTTTVQYTTVPPPPRKQPAAPVDLVTEMRPPRPTRTAARPPPVHTTDVPWRQRTDDRQRQHTARTLAVLAIETAGAEEEAAAGGVTAATSTSSQGAARLTAGNCYFRGSRDTCPSPVFLHRTNFSQTGSLS